MLLDLLDVALPGRYIDVQDLEPPVEELVHRRLASRIAAFVNLRQQSRSGLFGVAACGRTGGDDLREVVLLLGHRVDAGVDPHAE
jgi:hypothetical protein